MKTNLLKLVALLSLIAPLAGNAMSITYDVNRMVGTGTVTGSITTNGTIGMLTSTSITSFALAISDGTTTRQINSASGATVSGGGPSFAVTLSAITWVDPFGVGVLLFETPDFDAWRMGTDYESIVAQRAFRFDAQYNSPQILATAQATGLPEPGTLSLALIGLAGLGFSRNWKQRHTAAV